MRLRNIYMICLENMEKVKMVSGKVNPNNTAYTVVDGWNIFLESYKVLTKVPYLQPNADEIYKSVPDIYRHQNTFSVSNSEWNKINRNINTLTCIMDDVIKLYESMELECDEHIGIDIKLPKCDDFADFIKYIEELNFVLYKCPFFKIQGEDLKFNTFDVGSLWLNFVIAGLTIGATGSIIMNNLAAFFDKCLIIKSHKKTLEQQELLIQSMQIENKEKESMLKAINKLYETQVANCITELEMETGISLGDGEQRGVVCQAFEKTNLLIDKGLQIYTTIDSPNEVKALFQPLEMKFISVFDEKKQLEDKKNNN